MNSSHIPTPTKIDVPTLVSAISDGGRDVTRSPPWMKKITSAPGSPAANSQVCRWKVSLRVGAGTSRTEASTRLLNSGGRGMGCPSIWEM